MADEPKFDHLDPETSKWNSLVPELYFDLISRIPPGIVLIAAIVWAFYSPSAIVSGIKNFGWAVGIILLVSLVGAGHSVGILLTLLGSFVRRRFVIFTQPKIYDNSAELFGDLADELGSSKDSADEPAPPKTGSFPAKRIISWAQVRRFVRTLLDPESNEEVKSGMWLYRLLTEFVKSEDTQARVILPKMQAEASLCDNLAPAIILSLGIYCLEHHSVHAVSCETWLLTTSAVLLSVFASNSRHASELHRQLAFLRVIKRREKAEADASENTRLREAIQSAYELVKDPQSWSGSSLDLRMGLLRILEEQVPCPHPAQGSPEPGAETK